MAVTPQGKECSESALAILNMISLRTILLILPLTIWADLERFIWKLAEEKCRTENVHVTRFLHEAVFQLCTLFEMSYYLFHWPFRWTLERTKSYKPNLFNKIEMPRKAFALKFHETQSVLNVQRRTMTRQNLWFNNCLGWLACNGILIQFWQS